MAGGLAGPNADIRVISSISAELEPLVARGAFQNDLFYGLNIIEIRLPALRDRGDDILLLARQFAMRCC